MNQVHDDGDPDASGPVPRAAVGAVVEHDGRVLLVRRLNPPARGEWSIPGGRIRSGEGLCEAAERELLEETGLVVEAGDPIHAFDLIERDASGAIRFHYVIVDVIARYVSGEVTAGDDACEVAWFAPDELPHDVNANTIALLRKTGWLR